MLVNAETFVLAFFAVSYAGSLLLKNTVQTWTHCATQLDTLQKNKATTHSLDTSSTIMHQPHKKLLHHN
jgi:hypothetical protein